MKLTYKFWLLFRKEMLFLLRDRKTLFTSFVLTLFITPGIFGILQFIQNIQIDQVENTELRIGITAAEAEDPYIKFLDSQEKVSAVVVDDKQAALKAGDLVAYAEVKQNNGVEEVTYVFDEHANVSNNAVFKIQGLTEAYKAQLRAGILGQYGLNEAQITPFTFTPISIQKVTNEVSQDATTLFILPYIIIVGLLQGSLQYAIEITTGEKERNTLATTLGLNAPLTLIAFAKVSTTLVFSIIMAVLNVVSIVLAFRMFPSAFGGAITLTPEILLQLVMVLLPLSFFLSSLMVLLGIFARNQKEAGVYAMPLMLGSVVIGFAGNAFDVNTPLYVFAIPILGHVAALKQILQNAFTLLPAVILLGVTLLVFAAMVLITVKMFSREEVLFRQ